jgi:hypothetical protein
MLHRRLATRTLMAAVFLAGTLALLAGCSQSPTAPMTRTSAGVIRLPA